MREILTERVMLPVADGTTMGAFLARPRGDGRQPGLLVFQEAYGVNPHVRDVAQRFAHEGFCALAPELFHRTAPPGFETAYDFQAARPHYEAAIRPETLTLDVKAAFDWLRAQPFASGPVSGAGFCMGGRVAFFANTVVPLEAAVSFYGGGIAPALLDRALLSSGPILMLWGGRDQHIPPEQVALVAHSLRAAGKPFVNAEFSAADHAFFNDARVSFHPESARQAWALTLAFLKK